MPKAGTQSEKPVIAKLFRNGRSQAVRLPKEFRFAGEEVRVRRQGKGVLLEPVAEGWEWLDDIRGRLDKEVVDALREQPVPQERPELDKLFR